MRTSYRYPVLVLVLGLLAAACGGGSEDDESKRASAKDRDGDAKVVEASRGQVEATLQVRLERVGGKQGGIQPGRMQCTKALPATCTTEYSCPAADGDTVVAEVCTWLAGEGRAALTEEPAKDEVCTEIYGGPERLVVRGALAGDVVDRTFSRQDGCNIARFDAVSPLWSGEVAQEQPPVPGGGAAGTCLANLDDSVTSVAPDAPSSKGGGGSLADDTSCTVVPEPQPDEISDPPEAFE